MLVFCLGFFAGGCSWMDVFKFRQDFTDFFFEKLVTMGGFLDSFLPNALFEGSKK